MRTTAPIYFAIIAGAIAIIFLGITFDNWIIASIVGIVVAAVVYKLAGSLESGLHNAERNLLHGGNIDTVQEMLDTTIVFETKANREAVISELMNEYPTTRDKWALKQDWICQRINDDRGDYLVFAIGVVAFEWVRSDSTVPITMAKLDFQATPSGAIKATFSFVMRVTPNAMGVPHAKNMAELVERIKDDAVPSTFCKKTYFSLRMTQ